MKKYILAAVLSLGILASPTFTQAAGLTNEQIQAILSLLSSFGADSTIVTNVKTALTGGTPTIVSPSPSFSGGDQSGINRLRVCNVLQRNLSQGTQGDDVRSLQEFLGEEGHLSADATTGYFGPMTAQAVAKWQVAQGVQGVGSVGPMTRERIKIRCDSNKKDVSCPNTYMPVCGQPRYVCPGDGKLLSCATVMPALKTYPSRCVLDADGATFLYIGQCANDSSAAWGNDAAIHSNLSTVQTQAEFFYGGAGNNSYGTAGTACDAAGSLFTDVTIDKSIDNAGSVNGSGTVACNNSTTAYAVSAQLSNERTAGTPDYLCVDSTGSFSKSTTALGTNTVCPASN